jgi:L-ribulose-5-phosphate 4-epimerase
MKAVEQFAPELLGTGSRRESLVEAARIEAGLRSLLEDGGFGAFTDTFEDLHGLAQLPGVAAHRLMADGFGFGAEGDWKTAALVHGSVPVTRGLTATEIGGAYEANTGETIVEAIEAQQVDPLELPAALVRSHGPFAWGADAEDAVENAVALEAVAELAFRTLALRPDAPQIDPVPLRRHFLRKHGSGAYYGQR